MNPQIVQNSIARIRQILAVERQAELAERGKEEKTKILDHDMVKRAKQARNKLEREIRQDVRHEHQLDFHRTATEDMVEQLLQQEVHEDTIIERLTMANQVHKKEIEKNEKDIITLSDKILKLIREQELDFDDAVRNLQNRTASDAALQRVENTERKKAVAMREKIELLLENARALQRIVHNEQLISRVRGEKQRAIARLGGALQNEEADAKVETR